MDKNALTEKRRETVIGLLKSMNIKKSEGGGFDKDDVYECMQQLCDLYEKNIEELENAYEAELGSLKDKYQKYDDNNELYVSLIMEAKKSSNDIINQAKNEVENILNEGKEQVARQEKEMEQMRVAMIAEQKAIDNELRASRDALEAEQAAMKAEAEAEKEKMLALKNKYRQQINAMEGEFEELKTNILRTAARIDSLKSKLPDDDEVSWEVVNDIDAVDFPAAEVAVEQTIEAPAEPIHIEETLETAPPVQVDTEPEPIAAAPEEPAAAPEPAGIDVMAELAAEPEVSLEEIQLPDEIELPASEEETVSDEPLTLEELVAPLDPSPVSAQPDTIPLETESPVEELSFDDFDIKLPNLSPDAPAEPEEEKVEEISFEGLEELFKDEK